MKIALILLCYTQLCLINANYMFNRNIQVKNGSYSNVIVKIDVDENIPDRVAFMTQLKRILTQMSDHMYLASNKQTCFDEFVLLPPTSWLPDQNKSDTEMPDAHIIIHEKSIFGANPYTVQYGVCGTPGRVIHLSRDFVTYPEVSETSKVLLKEWVKYRYGVFDEHGFLSDRVYPAHTQKPILDKSKPRMLLTSCSYDEDEYEIEFTEEATNGSCYLTFMDLNSPKTARCEEYLKKDPVESSLMFSPKFTKTSKFCDDHKHNRLMMTKQNTLCNQKSVWEILNDHPDFSGVLKSEKCRTQFRNVSKSETVKHLLIFDCYSAHVQAIRGILDLHHEFLDANDIDYETVELQKSKEVKVLQYNELPQGHNNPAPNSICLACAIQKYLKDLAAGLFGPLTILTQGIVVDGDNITTKEAAWKLEKLGIIPLIIVYPYPTTYMSNNEIFEFARITHAQVYVYPRDASDFQFFSQTTFYMHKRLTLELTKNIPYRPILLNYEVVRDMSNHIFTFSIDNSISNAKYSVRILIICYNQDCGTFNLHNFVLVIDGNIQRLSAFKYHNHPNIFELNSDFRPGFWQLNTYGPKSEHSWTIVAIAQPHTSIKSKKRETKNVPSLKGIHGIQGECWLDKSQTIFELNDRDNQLNAYAFFGRAPLDFIKEATVELIIYNSDDEKVSSTPMRDDGAGNPDVTANDGIWSARINEGVLNNRFYRVEAKISHSSFKMNEGFNLLPCCGSRIPETKMCQTYFYLSRVVDCGQFFIKGKYSLQSTMDKIYDLSVSHPRDSEIRVEFTPSNQKNMLINYQFKLYNESDESFLNSKSYLLHNGLELDMAPQFKEKYVNVFLKLPEGLERSKNYYGIVILNNDKNETTFSRPFKFYVNEASSISNINNDNSSIIISPGAPNGATMTEAWEVVAIVVGSFMFILLVLLIIICLIAGKIRKESKLVEEKTKIPQGSPSIGKPPTHSYASQFSQKLYKEQGYDNKGSSLKDVGAISPVDSITVDKLMDHYGKVQKAKQRKEPPPVMKLEDIIDNVSNVSDNSRFHALIPMEDAYIPTGPELSWKFAENPNQIITPPYTYVEQPNYFMRQPPPPMIDVWRNSYDRSESPSDYDPRYGTIDKRITAVSQV